MKVIEPKIINDAVLFSSTVPEDDAPAYNAATSYALGAEVIVVAANTHLHFRSLQASNLGHDPLAEPDDLTAATWWIRLGATNRWKMFDYYLASQTQATDSITVVLKPSGVVNALALFNIECNSLLVKITDTTYGVVYEETHNLLYNDGLSDWYDYFFRPISYKSDYIITDLPNYSNVTIELTFSKPGGTVKIGGCYVGQFEQFGLTRSEAAISLIDYSVKTVDQFGNAKITRRDYARQADIELTIEKSEISRLFTRLASLRGIPVVYVGTQDHAVTAILGWYETAKQIISFEDYSVMNIKLQGLT